MEDNHIKDNLFSLIILKMSNLNKKENRENFSSKLSSGWIALIVLVSIIVLIAFMAVASSSSKSRGR